MGYRTYLNLYIQDIDGDYLNLDTDVDHPEEITKLAKEEDLIIEFTFDCKYDTVKGTEFLRKYSAKYPKLVFILKGDGEEWNDFWLEYFNNGKSYFIDLDSHIPDFNINLLEER